MLLGGAIFACLLMLKHLFLSLAPLYFVYLLRSYCCQSVPARSEGDGVNNNTLGSKKEDGVSPAPSGGVCKQTQAVPPSALKLGAVDGAALSPKDTGFVHDQEAEQNEAMSAGLMGLSLTRLAALGSVVLCVFGLALGPLCVSAGWAKQACITQLGQLGVRLFPFGRRVPGKFSGVAKCGRRLVRWLCNAANVCCTVAAIFSHNCACELSHRQLVQQVPPA